MILIRLMLLTVLCTVLTGACTSRNSAVLASPTSLEVGEGFVNPIGYYEPKPRFSWLFAPSDGASKSQSAYQIQVSSSPTGLLNKPDKWDSGKVQSSAMSWVDYQGKPLTSREVVFWRVRIWDDNNKVSQWSEVAKIELGLLNNSDWKAVWIGAPATKEELSPSKRTLATPQYFRKPFSVSKHVSKARLYVTAKGVFKVYLNGVDVSENDALPPGWTPYEKRIETLTYDVTQLVQQDANLLGATIAGGWYAGRIAGLMETDHTKPPRFMAQLEITYQDGATDIITTDSSWKSTQSGPVRFASNYDGEKYDQHFEMPGWNSPRFDDTGWAAVIEEAVSENTALRPKRHLPVRNINTLKPISFEQINKDTVVFDFGQNMVGVPSIALPVVAGKEVRLRFAEALNKGEFYTENYRSAHSTDYYLPARTEVASYTPTFTFHGYRYVEVSGFDDSKVPVLDWVSAKVQHSDVELYNNFSSANPKLNKLFSNINWGLKSNFFDIPLDCPQRDERLGWTGDANAFIAPSMYMADVYGFWAAYLESLREEQTEDGFVPLYIPFVEWINWTSSGWGDAATILPWELYMMTGDKKILEDSYPSMKAWVKYHESQASQGISTMKTFGDWLQPFPKAEGKSANRGDTDFSLISTAFFARSVELAAKTAKTLGHAQDAIFFENQHSELAKSFRNYFFDNNLNVTHGESTQTAYLLALAFNLLPESEVAQAQEKLVALLEASDTHLRTGFLGTPLLAQTLQKAGRTDLVYELLFKETYPSWFYSINNGATTTWERWNSYSIKDGFNPQGMNSLNHYAYGTISRWFYEGILGVTPATPGFKKVNIAPQLTSRLAFAEGSVPTPQGEVEVAWEVSQDSVNVDITIPFNTLATFIPPKGYRVGKAARSKDLSITEWSALPTGRYHFSLVPVINGKG